MFESFFCFIFACVSFSHARLAMYMRWDSRYCLFYAHWIFFPPLLQVLTVHSWGPSEVLVRISHSYESGDGALSANATISLANLFIGFNLTDITEMTLTANRALVSAPTYTYQVDGVSGGVTLPVIPPAPSGPNAEVSLSPMQIRTFRCTAAY